MNIKVAAYTVSEKSSNTYAYTAAAKRITSRKVQSRLVTFKGNCGYYFPRSNLFDSLHTACFMYGLSIYEIKKFQFMDPDSVSGFVA